MLNKSTIGLVAGVCGGLFIGYCIYFDKKRRSDPNYKKNVLEKRRREQEEKEKKKKIVVNYNDPAEMQRVFLRELETGEELLGQGEVEEAVEHLCNSIAFCPSPEQMINTLQATLPPQILMMILQRLPIVSQQLQMAREPMIRAKPAAPLIIDDGLDLE